MSNVKVDPEAAEFFGLSGGQISSDEWKMLFRTSKRYVKFQKVQGFEVETIWEGRRVRIGFNDAGEPLIYQTRVYIAGTRVQVGLWQWRSRGEALEGHQRIVTELGSGSYGPDSVDLHEVIL